MSNSAKSSQPKKKTPAIKKQVQRHTPAGKPAATELGALHGPVDEAAQLSPADMHDLQQTYGNRFVQRVSRQNSAAPSARPPLKATISRAGGDEVNGEVAPEIEGRIEQAQGGGHALPNGIKGDLEQQLGADFSGVKLHTDGEADALNKNLNAQAFTVGSDIFFRGDKYAPGSEEGQGLLAHELTHVVQQGASDPLAEADAGEATPGSATAPDTATDPTQGNAGAKEQVAEAKKEGAAETARSDEPKDENEAANEGNAVAAAEEKEDKGGEKKAEAEEKKAAAKIPGPEAAEKAAGIAPEELDDKKFENLADLGTNSEIGPLLPTWSELAEGTIQLRADVNTERAAHGAPPPVPDESAGPPIDQGDLVADAWGAGALAGAQEGASNLLVSFAMEAVSSKVPVADGIMATVSIASDPNKWADEEILGHGKRFMDIGKAFGSLADEDNVWGGMAALTEGIIAIVDFISRLLNTVNQVLSIIYMVAFGLSFAPFIGPFFSSVASFVASLLPPIGKVLGILDIVKMFLQLTAAVLRTLDLLETNADPEKLKKKQAKLQGHVKGFVSEATTQAGSRIKDKAVEHHDKKKRQEKENLPENHPDRIEAEAQKSVETADKDKSWNEKRQEQRDAAVTEARKRDEAREARKEYEAAEKSVSDHDASATKYDADARQARQDRDDYGSKADKLDGDVRKYDDDIQAKQDKLRSSDDSAEKTRLNEEIASLQQQKTEVRKEAQAARDKQQEATRKAGEAEQKAIDERQLKSNAETSRDAKKTAADDMKRADDGFSKKEEAEYNRLRQELKQKVDRNEAVPQADKDRLKDLELRRQKLQARTPSANDRYGQYRFGGLEAKEWLEKVIPGGELAEKDKWAEKYGSGAVTVKVKQFTIHQATEPTPEQAQDIIDQHRSQNKGQAMESYDVEIVQNSKTTKVEPADTNNETPIDSWLGKKGDPTPTIMVLPGSLIVHAKDSSGAKPAKSWADGIELDVERGKLANVEVDYYKYVEETPTPAEVLRKPARQVGSRPAGLQRDVEQEDLPAGPGEQSGESDLDISEFTEALEEGQLLESDDDEALPPLTEAEEALLGEAEEELVAEDDATEEMSDGESVESEWPLDPANGLPMPPYEAFERLSATAYTHRQLEAARLERNADQEVMSMMALDAESQAKEVAGTRGMVSANLAAVQLHDQEIDQKLDAQKAMEQHAQGNQGDAQQGKNKSAQGEGFMGALVAPLMAAMGLGASHAGTGDQKGGVNKAKEGAGQQAKGGQMAAEGTDQAVAVSKQRQAETNQMKQETKGVEKQLVGLDAQLEADQAGALEGQAEIAGLNEATAGENEEIAGTQSELIDSYSETQDDIQDWADEHLRVRTALFGDLDGDLDEG